MLFLLHRRSAHGWDTDDVSVIEQQNSTRRPSWEVKMVEDDKRFVLLLFILVFFWLFIYGS